MRNFHVTKSSILDTTYLVKAFYDATSPDTEANEIFDLVSTTGTNFAKGVRYSYIRNKRVFGGVLTWYSAKFQKVYNNLSPHY